MWSSISIAECISGDCTNGNGTFKDKYGDKYVGEWKDGKHHGQGTFVEYPSGNKYVGQWKDDKRHGQGTMTYPDWGGMKYVGEFKDDERHGQGTMTYGNGIKHVSVWDEGWATSQGTFTFVDGTTFVGSGRDYILIQSEKLSNKDSSLNAQEILELCKEYRVKDLGDAAYDGFGLKGSTEINSSRCNEDEYKTTTCGYRLG